MATFTGGCHCGNLSLIFQSEIAAADFEVRACGCSFCRRHRSRCVSDPAGSARIEIADTRRLSRYAFGLKTAEFLVCATCGVYIGALMRDDANGEQYVTLNTNAFADRAAFSQGAAAKDYDGESAAERQARRRQRWTPLSRFVVWDTVD